MKKLDEVRRNAGVVTMSNVLVRASQGLRLIEKRLVALACTKIKQVKGGPSAFVRITALEYAEAYDLDPSTAYTQLAEASDRLWEREFIIPVGDKPGDFKRRRWVNAADYMKSKGYVDFEFHRDVAPHLVGLEKQFTQYMLKQASALRSIYAWRLLELLMQFRETGWTDISVEAFSEALDVPESCKRDYFNLKNRVINPAIKELHEKDGWDITVTTRKESRRIAHLRFEFKLNPQGRLNLTE